MNGSNQAVTAWRRFAAPPGRARRLRAIALPACLAVFACELSHPRRRGYKVSIML